MKKNTWMAMATLALSLLISGSALAAEKRLSLNPYGSQLDNDAEFLLGERAPIVLPSEFRPAFYNGFTIPNDYKGGDLMLELLVETDATGCSFHLRTDATHRMQVRGAGDPVGAPVDLIPMNATTTPYGLTNPTGIVFAAEDVAGDTIRIRWELNDNDHSNAFAPGDGIHFGIFRETSGNYDTCEDNLHVGGMSIVYNRDRGLGAPGGYAPRGR